MDASSWIAAGSLAWAIVVVIGGGYIKANRSALRDLATSAAADHAAINRKIEDLGRDLDEYKLASAKEFITQPALLQVMNSLDRTIAALGDMIKENQKQNLNAMDALNRRIDEILNRRG